MEEKENINAENNHIQPTNQPKTEEQNKSEMEVHAHHNHNHSKRSFKSYLYEFFMLFLAVSAGFLVENLREYYVERHQEIQNIKNLHKNLVNDTIDLNHFSNTLDEQLKYQDTLISYFQKIDYQNYCQKIYYYSAYGLRSFYAFTISDATISQLKNAGGMRLIIRNGAIDSISNYYIRVDLIKRQSDMIHVHFRTILDIGMQIFDINDPGNSNINHKFAFITENKEKIKYYMNHVTMYSGYLQGHLRDVKKVNQAAKKLIKFLEKTYNINTKASEKQ